MVTEMVSSEGLVRGIDRTLEYAEYTEEERPIAIQIFGGDPTTMAAAAQVVEGMGADIVDVNMGCPVPKIAKHNAGCSLMRQPSHAAAIVRSMSEAVRIPVTVKMRAGWDEQEINASEMAEMMEDAGAAALAVHGRTAKQSYRGVSDWQLIADVAARVSIPVFGSGDCLTAEQVVDRSVGTGAAGVLVGRGALRNPWIFQQAMALASGRPVAEVTAADRCTFCSSTSTCCFVRGPTRRSGSATPCRMRSRREWGRVRVTPQDESGGLSTSCVPSAPGTRRVSTAGRSCARRSTMRRR